MNKKFLYVATLVMGMAFVIATLTPALGEDFYEGKMIRIIVGYTPGGVYDIWSRLLSRHMGNHIPGSPKLIVVNMPGASSRIAANYFYNITKPNGLSIGIISNNSFLDQVIGRGEVKYDLSKFNWIGTQTKSPMLLYILASSPIKSIWDIINAKEPLHCGAQGPADQTYIMVKLLEETIGAKIKLVMGYRGGVRIDLAMERKEIECRATSLSVHYARDPFLTWDKEGFDRHIIQTGRKRDVRLADIPTLYELMDEYKTPEISRRMAEVILGGTNFARPLMTTPGTPMDRVKILREAYAKTMKDPEFLAEAKKLRLEVNPYIGEELQAKVNELLHQAPDIVARLKVLLR